MLFKYLRGVGSAVRRPLVYDVGRQSCISPPLRRAQHFYSTVEKPLSYADFSLELPKVSVISRDIAAGISENILVLPFFQGGDEFKAEKLVAAIPSTAPSAIRQILVDAINMGGFTAESGSELFLHAPIPSCSNEKGSSSNTLIVLVGLGKKSVLSKSSRALGKHIALLSPRHKGSACGVLPMGMEVDISQLIYGMCDAAYHDMRFRKADGSNGPKACVQESLTLYEEARESSLDVEKAHIIASGVKLARDLVGAPANAKTPILMSSIARELGKQYNLDCTILGEDECVRRGMGGYLAVQQGSKFPPQFIHMIYRPENRVPSKKIVLIGKGLTFDSGGYNLKVGAASAIETMKIDMGGLAAVLGCAKAIAQLKPASIEVHFLSAVCENMVSADAVRPGDVVTASNGKTIEVVNTDAEGRLTLADALVYGQSIGGVDAIIDLATLTGACIVGLGDKVAGLYSSDKRLLQDLVAAAERSDEKVWPLPLEDCYRERIKSPIANIRNVGGSGGGGSITAALFLQEFVHKETPWAHIDIAGPVWDDKLNKPTGFGVQLLVEYLLNLDRSQIN